MKRVCGDKMNEKLEVNKDDFFEDDFFAVPHFVELDENNDFSDIETLNEEKTVMDDEEFDRVIKSLIANDKETKEDNENLSLDEERSKFEIEKELAYEKLRLEKEELEQEKAHFARYRKEWETLKKLSEESFQAEKEEYEKQKQLEKEKMYLETKEIINSCANFNEFLENYKKIHDVSR